MSYPPYGYQGYPGYYAPPPPPDHPQATTAMVLGIISLVGGFACLVPMLIGPVAWYMGNKARKEIDASNGMLGGRGTATAGFACGIIATAFLALGVLVYGAMLVVMIVDGTTL